MIRSLNKFLQSQTFVAKATFFDMFKKPKVKKETKATEEKEKDQWDAQNWDQMGAMIKNIKELNLKKPKLLPLQSPAYKNKLTVVLEIDEVLMYSFAPDPRENWMTAPIRNWDYSVGLPEFDTWIDIYKREHLEEFLQYWLNETEPIIWSCGHSSYVKLVMSQICPEFPSSQIFTQDNCNLVEEPDQTLEVFYKDINLLGRDINKIVYVDSKPLNFWGTGSNSLPVTVFTADNTDKHSKDDLLTLIDELKILQQQTDLREYLTNRYKIEETQRECKLIL